MNTQDTSRILNAVARDYVPEEINLLPRILSSLEKKNDARLKSRRSSLALIVLVTVLILAGGSQVRRTCPSATTAFRSRAYSGPFTPAAAAAASI